MARSDKLSEKEKKFALEFRKNGGNATKAAIVAGYSEKTASTMAYKLVHKSSVQNYIDLLRKDAMSRTIMGITERQETLTSIARNELADEADRNRAIDILNKMDGLYLVRVDVNVKCSIGAGLGERMLRFDSKKK